MELSDVERAYLAGLFDGEGSITLYFSTKVYKTQKGSKRYWYPKVQFVISNTDRKLMESVKENLKVGGVYTREHKYYKPISSFRTLSFSDILNVISYIEPFTRLKKEQLKICRDAINFLLARKRGRATAWKDEDIKGFQRYVKKLKKFQGRLGRSRVIERPLNFR